MDVRGSGKSTYIKNNINKNNKEICISRDEIRLNLITDKEEYFSKEKEVYREYINRIEGYLSAGYDVYADATNINKKSREKLINRLNINPNKIIGYYMKTPLEVALKRNENRKGMAAVPASVITSIYNSLELPTEDELDEFYIIENDIQTKIF